MADVGNDLIDFQFDKAKKKKKQKVSFLPSEGATPQDASASLPSQSSDTGKPQKGPQGQKNEEEIIDFVSMKKTKKRVSNRSHSREETDADGNADNKTAAGHNGTVAVASITKLYEYQTMLERVYTLMQEMNPDLMDSSRKMLLVKTPSIVRAGSKKTAFTNFHDVCLALNRSHEHFSLYIFSELGTNGSIDQSRQLIMKGRFTQKQIENVIFTYVRDYVRCTTCKSQKTDLIKKDRIHFISCMDCHSQFSVLGIKSGMKSKV